jgi:hypothetical protein
MFVEVLYCDSCDRSRCDRCVRYVFCEYECYKGNCAECSSEHSTYNVKDCMICGASYCGAHLLMQHVRYGHADFCRHCNSRAALVLSEYNSDLFRWVNELEKKYGYGNEGRDSWESTTDNFDQAMEARNELFRRCLAVGNNLSAKQKQFEKFDYLFKQHKSILNF